MLIQQIAPVAEIEFASIFVALELSRSKWLVGVGTPQKWTVGRHQVEGGDLDGLLALLSRIGAGEERRLGGRESRIFLPDFACSCYVLCVPKARFTSGGRFHPESCRLIW